MFYRTDFWGALEADVEVAINGSRIRYLQHFEVIFARTGAHVSEGNLFADGIEMPARLCNQEVATHLVVHLTRASAPAGATADPLPAPRLGLA